MKTCENCDHLIMCAEVEDRLNRLVEDGNVSNIAACNHWIGWIPVEEEMPKEKEAIFAKYVGTDKWNNFMFRTTSDRVIVCWEFESGERIVKEGHTHGGEFFDNDIKLSCKKAQAVAWRELPKYEGSKE